MGLLNILKKREELPSDIDLDLPPAPPEIGMEEDIPIEEPVDEELMFTNKRPIKAKPSKAKEEFEELPELPPLPEEEEQGIKAPIRSYLEEPEMPPLPEEELSLEDLEEESLELPPPPEIKKEKRKGLFSFLKTKKVVEKIPLAKKKEFPEMPSLPKFEEEELSEIPPLTETEEEKEFPEIPTLPEEEIPPSPPITEQILPSREELIKKTRFIAINDFEHIQNEINNIKITLKGSEPFFAKLEEDKPARDKKYEEFRNYLDDIHKKIMFVDKNLFKGG